MNNSYIDISWPITPQMTSYKNKKPITLTTHASVARDGVTDSSITMNLHTGTHIDAPLHFVKDGAAVDTINLETLNGPCRVLDLTTVAAGITDVDLRPYDVQPRERILLKTQNSARAATEPFDFDGVYLAASGAQYLAECGVILVGIDALGIERAQPKHETHRILFSHNITILEGLRLGQVKKEAGTLYALPLALHNVEAAPVRALLM